MRNQLHVKNNLVTGGVRQQVSDGVGIIDEYLTQRDSQQNSLCSPKIFSQ